MTASRTLVERTLADLCASTYLTRLGVEVEEARTGEARGRLRATLPCINRAGMVHGGAIATVLLGASEIAAAASERERHTSELSVATLNVSFLDAVRAGAEIEATAHVLRRGRDVIHVAAEAHAADAGSVAHAILVYRLREADEARRAAVPSRAARASQTPRERVSASPYMCAAEALLLEGDREWTCMSLPSEPNEAVAGRVHDGAIVGLVDTCAAIAAFKSRREQGGRPSATVSIALAWSAPTLGDMCAGARVIGRQDALFTTEAEVWGADGAMRLSGLVCYRIAGARP